MNLDKRSKIIIGLIIVVALVLVWQLGELFGEKKMIAPSQVATKTYANPTQVVANNDQNTVAMLNQSANNIAASDNQEKYLALVNEYQMVEIQRMIAQDQASIAQSRAAAADSLAKMAEASGGTINPSDMAPANAAPSNSGDYELIYTGQDNGEWTATLKKNGQFNDVTTGSILPDGSKVLSVDDNGVLIQQGNDKKLVTFNGITPFSQQQSPEPQVQSSPASPAQPQKIQAPAAPAPVKVVPKPEAKPVVVATNVSTAQNNYTLQIVADSDINTVNNFIKQNNLVDKAHAVKTTKNNKPWYIGVYGEFPDIKSATKAIKQLPDNVQDEEPFVRKISDLQTKVGK